MTRTLTAALKTLAGQQLAALTAPGAYSASLTGGYHGCTITQLRALHRRGLANRVTVMGCEAYTITDAGLLTVADYVRAQCAEVQTSAGRALCSPYPGVVSWAEQRLAGANHLLSRLK